MLSWLRKCGKAGETLAWILALIETKLTWAAIISLGLGFLAAFWSGLFNFFSNQHTQIAIGVFLAALWTYIGLRIIRRDYRYSLNPEGFQLYIDPDSTDLALSVGINFRNICTHPIRIRVEEFRLKIEDRTCADPDTTIEMIVPRVSARGIRSGGFKKDVLKNRNSGTLSLIVIYGPPDGEFIRRYRYKTKLHFAFTMDTNQKLVAATVGEEYISDSDEPV